MFSLMREELLNQMISSLKLLQTEKRILTTNFLTRENNQQRKLSTKPSTKKLKLTLL